MAKTHRFLFGAPFAVLAALFLFGCPPIDDDDTGGDDDDSSPTAFLCTGPGCQNAGDCPSAEPDDGDPCTFNGNCHYCPGTSDTADGYTCDGTSFSYQGTFTCNP